MKIGVDETFTILEQSVKNYFSVRNSDCPVVYSLKQSTRGDPITSQADLGMLIIDSSNNLNIFNNQTADISRTFYVEAKQGPTAVYKQISIEWTLPVAATEGTIQVGPPGRTIDVVVVEERPEEKTTEDSSLNETVGEASESEKTETTASNATSNETESAEIEETSTESKAKTAKS